jgi:t-SNARE complex subunit (syntaxin)
MSDSNERVVSLLEELVDLQKQAAVRQGEILQLSQQNFAEAKQRTEASIDLQRVAVDRQRRFVRLWLIVVLPLIAIVIVLLYWLSRLARYIH